MKTSIWCLCLTVTLASAGVLKERTLSYVRALSKRADVSVVGSSLVKQTEQKPLQETLDESYQDAHSKTARLEINSGEFFGFPYYSTNVALGTPNQAFRMVLDLDFGGLLVRVPGCGDNFGCGHGFEYNHSMSSTYVGQKERFGMQLPAHRAEGTVSMDSLQLVSLNVSNVTFGEVDDFHGENLWYLMLEEIADGAIGFGPPNSSVQLYTDTEVPNVLHNVLSEGVLEKNIMTLSLPYSPPEQGSLFLGGIPPEADKWGVRLPLDPSKGGQLADTWHIGIDTISLVGNTSLEIALSDHYAGFELGLGFAFPRNVTMAIWDALDAEPEEGNAFGIFNCTKWDSLPDLVLNFSGYEVTMAREDYAFHGSTYPGGGSFCAVNISPEWFSNNTITLGVTFMRKFHMVFDMEEKELSLIEKKEGKSAD